MNERIKELLEQCTDQQMTKPWPLVDTEKFAELIVRECADWMENATVTDSAGNKDHIGDSTFWADELKEHFGVKE